MSLLVEDFADNLDAINDALTDLTVDEFDSVESITQLLNTVDRSLADYALKLDLDDVENVAAEWEQPSEFEAINILLPLYDKDNEPTEYNLSMTYAISDPSTNSYIVDFEVQYEWEMEDEIGTEYIDFWYSIKRYESDKRKL